MVNICRTPYSPTALESTLNSHFNHVLIILKHPLGKKLWLFEWVEEPLLMPFVFFVLCMDDRPSNYYRVMTRGIKNSLVLLQLQRAHAHASETIWLQDWWDSKLFGHTTGGNKIWPVPVVRTVLQVLSTCKTIALNLRLGPYISWPTLYHRKMALLH